MTEKNPPLVSDLPNPKKFALIIEEFVTEYEITHMDAVLLYCEKRSLEPSEIKRLVTKPLREKLEHNARELNFLTKTGVLPI